MVFSLCACGKEQKAGKYCFNCGKGISKNVTFCEHCGANVKENGNENFSSNTTTSSTPDTSTTTSSGPIITSAPNISSTPTTSSKPTTTSTTTSSKPTTSTTTTSSKPTTTTTTHTHSYSIKIKPATCTTQGYTTYTCSCGDTYTGDYISPSHSYTKYKCTKCGAVDKSHTYEYLVEWVKTNGTKNGENIEYIYEGKNNPNDRYGLTYFSKDNYLAAWHFSEVISGVYSHITIDLNSGFYAYYFYDDKLYGTINKTQYSNSTTLTYFKSECNRYTPAQLLPTAKSSIDVVLNSLEVFLLQKHPSITLYDLGFKSF